LQTIFKIKKINYIVLLAAFGSLSLQPTNTVAQFIAAGAEHSFAVCPNNTIMAFGRNNFGQLGDGTTTNATTPFSITTVSGIVAVSCGEKFSQFLKSD